MASKNKFKKLKNSFQYKTTLKLKGKGIKRMSFYTSSQRQENKKTHYHEDGKTLCGLLNSIHNSVMTKTSWYALSDDVKCLKCKKQIAIRTLQPYPYI